MSQTATVTYLAVGTAQLTAQCEGVTSPTVPVTVAAASTPAQRILAYITALPQQATHRCVVGEMDDNGAAIELASINSLQVATGKYVGMCGVGYTYNRGDLTNICQTAWTTRGMLITGICTFLNPVTGGDESDTTAALHATATVGTTAHNNFFNVQLPSLVTSLNAIKAAIPGVCLIIRPFHEQNGNWFWWCNGAVADYVSLWQQTYSYLMTSAGLSGTLLWDFGVYAGQGNYTKYYPGAAFVDIVSFDYYGDTPATGAAPTYTSLLSLNKPTHWAEFGPHNATGPITPNSFDNVVVLNAVKNNFPKLWAVSCWNGWWAWGTQLNASTLINDAIIATAGDVHATTR